jgi:hypothetical protein
LVAACRLRLADNDSRCALWFYPPPQQQCSPQPVRPKRQIPFPPPGTLVVAIPTSEGLVIAADRRMIPKGIYCDALRNLLFFQRGRGRSCCKSWWRFVMRDGEGGRRAGGPESIRCRLTQYCSRLYG